MMANETLPSFIVSDWQDRNDDFQFQAGDFDTLFDESEAEFSAGVEANPISTEPSYQNPTSWPFQDTQGPTFQSFQDTQGPKSSGSETKMVFTDAPQLPSSTNASGQGLVNVYLIVDPATQQVFCPKQLLVHNSGAETQTAMFGPIFLNSFPKDTIQNLTNYVTQKSAEQFIAPDTYSSPSVNRVPIAPFSRTAATEVTAYPYNAVSSNSTVVSVSSSSDNQSYAPPLMLAPLRALSAYNFFFRDERNRILHGGPMELTPAKQHRLLQEHCCQDRTKKRRHRKTHGMIDFTTLSKLISKRWKGLPEDQKDFYREVASLDWERYQTVLSEQRNLNIAAVAPTGSNNFFAVTG
jgi:hypothetical protein